MRRREFVASLGACGTYVATALAMGGTAARQGFAARPRGRVMTTEPWGRLEEIADGAWALISTPLAEHPRAHLTVANGGIVAGRNGVAIIEGLVSEEGARWLSAAARELTGRDPDHVVLTHYHGDHSSGLSAYPSGGPVLHASEVTLGTLRRGAARRDRESPASGFTRAHLSLVGNRAEDDVIDLGGRRLRIRKLEGHTDSDLVVTLEDPPIIWCGDLVWNGLFPNYVDATPSRLSASVRRVASESALTWVPGHGALADREAIERYVTLIDDVEDAARRAIERGDGIEAAAAGYEPPASLGEWAMFSPRYHETAFRAWARELRGTAP